MYFQYHASAITIRMLVLAGMLRRKIGCNSSLETWTGVTQSGEPPLEKVYAIRSITKDAIVLSVRFAAILKRRFS